MNRRAEDDAGTTTRSPTRDRRVERLARARTRFGSLLTHRGWILLVMAIAALALAVVMAA